MKIKKELAVALGLLAAFSVNGQKISEIPHGYYRAPMDIPMFPSANFAETRPNHFHSGIDIKTQGVEGEKLYSVADGYISRIGVAPGGYGRSLYITHNNGTTSVYGHMQRFAPEIEKYVDNERYLRKLHNVDLFPDAGKFPVERGGFIGYSGNSGSSGGPHLHLEIRETATQKPLNVLARGYVEMKDDIAPKIVNLYYIEIDTVGIVPVYSKPRLLGVKSVVLGEYRLNGTDTVTVGPKGYFVIEVTDRKNDSDNTMGVYDVSLSLDDAEIFGFKLDQFDFADTRYVNSLMQYDMQEGSRNQLLRLARQGNNKLQIFRNVKSGGLVMPQDSLVHPVSIIVSDDTGNVSTLSFNVKKDTQSGQFYSANDVQGIPVDCYRTFSQSLPGIEVTIPAGALYEPIFFHQSQEAAVAAENGNAVKTLSGIFTLHDPKTPIHSSITLSLTVPDGVVQEIYPKLCLASVSADGKRFSYAGGSYVDGVVKGTLRSFGKYCIVADTIPPVITASFANGADLRNAKSVYFTLKDGFSGISSYNATIDGQWIAFEQNNSGRITHHFDPARVEYKGQKHKLVLEVTDGKGNTTKLTREFTR